MRAALHLDSPLAAIPGRLAAHGLRRFQATLRNPQRFGNTDAPDGDDRAAYMSAAGGGPPLWGIVHGTLLTNLASPKGRIWNASVSSRRPGAASTGSDAPVCSADPRRLVPGGSRVNNRAGLRGRMVGCRGGGG